ncbi:MAG: diguanylate cyclase [Pseudomonadota bacterium]
MDALPPAVTSLLDFLIDRINIGIFAVNRNMECTLWNRFMESHSGVASASVLCKNLFQFFDELPHKILYHKINSVFILKNFAFTSWEQRPYLFKFRHHRPVTGGVEYMYQDCTFIPLKDPAGEVQQVCVTLIDVTDTAVYQKMMKEAMTSLAEASNRDGLTGIYNRRCIEEVIMKECQRVQRYGGTLSLAFIDLDRFKEINDTYGHLAGDDVLRITSTFLNESLRQIDALGRYGGEEFVAVLPATDIEGAYIVAERLCRRLADIPVHHNEIDIRVTASVGIAEWQPTMSRYEDLIKAADQALYQAKADGRNCVRRGT